MKPAVNAYQVRQINAAVLGVSHLMLIAKLLSGAIDIILESRTDTRNEDMTAKGEHIKVATSIISDGLRGSLNMDEGGELAQRLDALYAYMLQQLMKAHVENDVTILDEIVALLAEIKAGWDGIKDQV